jgi:hypothetical protein
MLELEHLLEIGRKISNGRPSTLELKLERRENVKPAPSTNNRQ